MPWLQKLDTRSTNWPTPARWLYFGTKWYLIALGGFMLIRLSLDRIGVWSLY